MNSENYDWSSFCLRISINTDWSRIYRACATQQGLEKWFLRDAKFVNTYDEKRKKTGMEND